MITLVYAMDKNGGIGLDNKLPWHLPNDLKFFKTVTMESTIVMGRKTFESMGKRLLPGRKSVVLTRNLDYGKDIEGLTVVHTIEEVLKLSKEEKVHIIGGAQVFEDLLPYANRIIRTVIDGEFEIDTWMPMIDPSKWAMMDYRLIKADKDNKHEHAFERWVRI